MLCLCSIASSLKLREIGQILNYNNIEVVELNKNKIENYNLPIEIKRSNILKTQPMFKVLLKIKLHWLQVLLDRLGKKYVPNLKI